MPRRRQRAGLGFAIPDNAGDDEIWVVEGRSLRVCQGITQLAAFVDRARDFGRHMAGHAAWEGELFEETGHTAGVSTDPRVNLTVGAFKPRVGHDAGTAMSGPDNIYQVDVLGGDNPIEVGVDEVEAGGRTPVAQEPGFDVLGAEFLLEQRVVEEVDLAHRQVIGRPQ